MRNSPERYKVAKENGQWVVFELFEGYWVQDTTHKAPENAWRRVRQLLRADKWGQLNV